ncbi:MAG: ATP-binding cassette domain-containing protein [Clostridia bacterium]|nr:ATP-binding cassette domain-containing protein [Clostridia bacterium]
MSKYLLEMNNITKTFPGVKALDGVSFRVRHGSVHALMGENGAGKSTLMKCLFGIYEKDSGEILLDGKVVHFKNPRDALDHGVAMVHQELNQALCRSVSDNIWLGRYPKSLALFTADGEADRKTREIFASLDIDVDPREIMSRLSVSTRQTVEIAKAVSYGAKVIVLDEPTSSLNGEETERLFRIIEMLKNKGCGIIYISHKMEEIRRISDEVTVMRDGRHVATDLTEAMPMERIISLMVGRELKERFPKKQSPVGNVILEVKNLSGEYNHVRDVSFTLREGEVLGVAGLGGAGRTELLETVFGIAKAADGEIILRGRHVKNRSPAEAKRNGFALITEERRRDGIFGILPITENTVIASLKNYRAGGVFLRDKAMRRETDRMIGAMKVKTPGRKTKIRSLSGGNQQKVILGRWLLTDPDVLLLDEPTRGIDVGAKYEIYTLIHSLAARGRGVIVVSSEMPELLGICDRIMVMSGGRVAGDIPVSEATQEEIMRLAAKYV